MGKRLGWLAALAVVVGAAALVARRRGGGFDPARPAIDWGTVSLTIDEAEQ